MISEFHETLNFFKRFLRLVSLSLVHLKSAYEVDIFIFSKINKEFAWSSNKTSSRVGKMSFIWKIWNFHPRLKFHLELATPSWNFYMWLQCHFKVVNLHIISPFSIHNSLSLTYFLLVKYKKSRTPAVSFILRKNASTGNGELRIRLSKITIKTGALKSGIQKTRTLTTLFCMWTLLPMGRGNEVVLRAKLSNLQLFDKFLTNLKN